LEILGEGGLKIANQNATNRKWWIEHATDETDDNCGNLNFYINPNSDTYYDHMAFIEDDPGFYAVKMNFTGSHRVVEAKGKKKIDLNNDVGLIVVASGDYNSLLPELKKGNKDNITINEALPTVRLCDKRKDKRVIGVISGEDELDENNKKKRVWRTGGFNTLMKKEDGDDRFEINSLGEGAVWVCDTNGNFENGDFMKTRQKQRKTATMPSHKHTKLSLIVVMDFGVLGRQTVRALCLVKVMNSMCMNTLKKANSSTSVISTTPNTRQSS